MLDSRDEPVSMPRNGGEILPVTEVESSHNLENLVEKQHREIQFLKERLSMLETATEYIADVSENESYVSSARKRTTAVGSAPVAEERAVEVLAGVTGDQALSIAFPALLRGLTDKNDVHNVKDMCQIIVGEGLYGEWEDLFKAFYDCVVRTRDLLPPEVVDLEASLPEDWHHEPWYMLYVQWMGVETSELQSGADFDNLRHMLPYIRDRLGFRNICLLPHYESPMADGGYDVSSFTTRASLGGEEAFQRFMKDALRMGLRVATDAVFNHTSTEHEWFQKALEGDEKYIAYYVQRNGREKIGEWDRDGDIVCRYRDPDGTITERVVVFPDVDRTHGLWVEINGKTYQFYRGFFPFQVDLNLQNPDVISELFEVLSREVRQGVLGKRMDAIAHWVKKPGSASEGLPECHAVQALLKSFLKHVNRRCIVMPEVVRDMTNASKYAGIPTTINSAPCPSEGDAILSFEMQAALREMIYFQTVAPYWRRIFRAPALPQGGTWVNLIEHHDETFMGFFGREVRVWLAEYIKTHGGIVYKNGMSAGGRAADCLNQDEQRIATAIFVLFVTPGTPLIYAGTEIGASSNHEHAQRAAVKAHETFERLGVFATRESCFDPRELQRGPIPRAMFEDVLEDGYTPLQIIQKMNSLRRKCASLRSGQTRPLDSGDIGVLCIGRGAEVGETRVLCLANLTSCIKWAAVPVAQAIAFWELDGFWEQWGGRWEGHLKFVDDIEGKCLRVESAPGVLRFWLAAFGRAVVRAVVIAKR